MKTAFLTAAVAFSTTVVAKDVTGQDCSMDSKGGAFCTGGSTLIPYTDTCKYIAPTGTITGIEAIEYEYSCKTYDEYTSATYTGAASGTLATDTLKGQLSKTQVCVNGARADTKKIWDNIEGALDANGVGTPEGKAAAAAEATLCEGTTNGKGDTSQAAQKACKDRSPHCRYYFFKAGRMGRAPVAAQKAKCVVKDCKEVSPTSEKRCDSYGCGFSPYSASVAGEYKCKAQEGSTGDAKTACEAKAVKSFSYSTGTTGCGSSDAGYSVCCKPETVKPFKAAVGSVVINICLFGSCNNDNNGQCNDEESTYSGAASVMPGTIAAAAAAVAAALV